LHEPPSSGIKHAHARAVATTGDEDPAGTVIHGNAMLIQALVGLLQFAIGLAMLVGYRRTGVWGEF
jgi:hypothetical protein